MHSNRLLLYVLFCIGCTTTTEAQNFGINISTPEHLLDMRGVTIDSGAVVNLASQDLSHFLRMFSGKTADPYPFILWREGDPLRFAVGDGGGVFTERMRIRSGGIIGINNMSPQYPLQVNEPSGVLLTNDVPIILGEYKGTNTEDVIGVKGYSRPVDYYGIGGAFEGGWHGVEGKVIATGSAQYTGVFGEVTGGGGTNYAVYGNATGTGTNWAGYFNSGHVYVGNRLGIGQLHPLWPLDISAPQAVARMITSTSINGSVVQLRNMHATPSFLGALNFNNSVNSNPGQLAYTGDNAMTFRTNGIEQMRIKSNGFIGIGTANPESWVDIYRNSSSAVPLLTLRENDIDYARMNFKIGLLPFEWAIKAFPSGITGDADFLIQYSGLNVAGTRLQIKGTGETVIPTGLDASLTTNGFLMLGTSTSTNTVLDNNEILARNNGVSSTLSLQRDGGDVVLCELENGRVRIGSTPASLPSDPSYLLAIGGKAICEELKVQLQGNWPDYVFNENYKLAHLLDLEREIQRSGHLPGVPSAAEVRDHGIEVGEMQRILLEKVEELTLYVIELKKENEILAEEVSRIKNKN